MLIIKWLYEKYIPRNFIKPYFRIIYFMPQSAISTSFLLPTPYFNYSFKPGNLVLINSVTDSSYIDENFCHRATQYRSSHRRCSVEKGVLQNFGKFTGKHLCWSLFLIKLQVL